MIICEFCSQYRANGTCGFGLPIRRGMRCHEFEPGVAKFCANPADFKGVNQLVQMATYFGIKGLELKKIREMAAQEKARQAGALL